MYRRLNRAYALASLQFLLVVAASAGSLLHAQGHVFRWGTANTGAIQVITYAILNDHYTVPGGKSIISPDNCGSMHAFSTITDQSPGITPDVAAQQLREAFAIWESVAAVKFIHVDDAERANIVIGAADQPSGRAFTNLSYLTNQDSQPVSKALGKSDEYPSHAHTGQPETVAEIEQAYVCLNPTLPWKAGFDGNLRIYDLKYTFTHEIGHAIGLDHPGKTGAVMAYRYDESVPKLSPSDIAAVQSIYGPNLTVTPPNTTLPGVNQPLPATSFIRD